MRVYLSDRMDRTPNRRGFHVRRTDLETFGKGAGLNVEQSIELFRNLEGVYWRGEYHESQTFPRSSAWVDEVR